MDFDTPLLYPLETEGPATVDDDIKKDKKFLPRLWENSPAQAQKPPLYDPLKFGDSLKIGEPSKLFRSYIFQKDRYNCRLNFSNKILERQNNADVY